MSVIAAAVRHMLASGMNHDAIVTAVAEMEAAMPLRQEIDPAVARKRAADRERMRAKREVARQSRDNGDITRQSQESRDNCDSRATSFPPAFPAPSSPEEKRKVSPWTPSKEKTHPPSIPTPTAPPSMCRASDEPTLPFGDPPQPKAAKAKPERKAGSRLPDDWRPSPEDRAYAAGEGFSDWETDRVALRFADYWRARPGQGGVKLDWPATWRNWVRTEADRQGKAPKAAASPSPQPLPVRDIHDPAYRGARPAQRRDVDLTPEQEAARQARAASLRAAAERIDAARAAKAGGA